MRSSSKFSSFFSCLIQAYFLCSELAAGCFVAERRALLQFRNGLHDPEIRLSSWRGRECCSWRGVKCDNQTGSVISINLSNPYPNIVGYENSHQSHGFWNLSGEIDSSLLQLKSLEQLDLSHNTFEGIPIPSFFGSLKKLSYLNLSEAEFSGTVPPQLGNLTKLQYLDLSSSSSLLEVDDFEWISRLSSLKVLSMNTVNLLMVESDLFRALNRLSSLKELHMSYCSMLGIVQNLPLINLTSLRVMDLSFNQFFSVIPSWFANLTSLVYLDLSRAEFFGPIPSWISSLRFIDLSANNNLTGDISELLGGNWRHVENIRLAFNRVQGSLPYTIKNLTSLVELNLYGNNIEGGIPSSIGKLCNLESLDLGGNNLSFSLPRSLEVQGCFSDKPLQKLHHFKMNSCGIKGILPEWLGELQNLVVLDLVNNNITGSIPPFLGNLPLLTHLILGENQLNGPIPPTIGNLSLLTELNLEKNQLNGSIPPSLGNLSLLTELWLDENQLNGPIPQSLGNLLLLTELGLGKNQLNGPIPLAIGNLSKLETFDVSFNQLTGTVKEEHFLKLIGLQRLVMSSNPLIMKFGSSWVPPFHIFALAMGSCQLGPQFPSWIRNQSDLEYLDISNNSISGEIPRWFWDLFSNLEVLDISFNKLEGFIPNTMKISGIVLLDLSHNNFSGFIPSNFGQLQPGIIKLSLSYNNLSGTIPSSIGDIQHLEIINLSNNHFIGSIPSSLKKCSYLKVLDFEHNNLLGQIPRSLGSLVQLQTLHLSNNGLSGLIPQSLYNCTSLETLDLGNNDFTGLIPSWLGVRLPKLHILRLRSNKFTGQIPSQLSNLKSLQVLDLAKNLLFGTIPHSFGALESMNTPSKLKTSLIYGSFKGTYYEESISIEIKERQLIYTKTLSLVTCIDLSKNNLSGEFPETFTNLSGLIILNLSENRLTGKIPRNIHKMKELESLDLSKNDFFGEIPKIISSLMFLSNLNLSNNNFSGIIPEGGQMTTFSSSAFSGNKFLCGQPLAVVCKEDIVNLNNTYDQNNGDDMNQELVDDWFYLTFGLGFAVGLLGLVAVLLIRKPWADIYFNFVDWLVKRVMNVNFA